MNQESSRPGRFLLVIFIWHKDSFYAKQAITIFANFPKIAFVECFGMSRTLEQVAFLPQEALFQSGYRRNQKQANWSKETRTFYFCPDHKS